MHQSFGRAPQHVREKSAPVGMRLVVNDAKAQARVHTGSHVSTSGCCVTMKTPSALTHAVPACHLSVLKLGDSSLLGCFSYYS